MKKYFFLLFFAALTSPIFTQSDSAKTKPTSTDNVYYTCSMHPEVISNKPGKCPKCGMDLVQKTSSSSENKMNMMMCPMHGMNNMNMEKNAPVSDDTTKIKTDSIYYTCSMHPEIKSAQPGNCPKCGMKLVKVEQNKPQKKEEMKMNTMCPMMNGMNDMNEPKEKKKSRIGMIAIGMGAMMAAMMLAMLILI